MAIKISGNTVIDDSRNLFANTITATTFTGDGSNITGLAEFPDVGAPTNVSPAAGATNEGEGGAEITLCASAFVSLFGNKSHANSQFQVSQCIDFSDCIFVDKFTSGVTNFSFSPGIISLPTSTIFYFRAKYIDNEGCQSSFSSPTCFITASTYYPSALGESYGGGFYMGTISYVSGGFQQYYLIMAPNSTGCASCSWKTTRTCSSVGSNQVQGFENTYDHLANATHPAGNWTATRTIGGFSDWYLPAMCELNQLYTNKACAPAGEGFASAYYWASTERDAITACRVDLGSGDTSSYTAKEATQCIRAIRRVPF